MATIFDAMEETIRVAKEKNKLYYLYRRSQNSEYFISTQYWKDWIFKAYPGGRKILSLSGKQIINEEI